MPAGSRQQCPHARTNDRSQTTKNGSTDERARIEAAVEDASEASARTGRRRGFAAGDGAGGGTAAAADGGALIGATDARMPDFVPR
ncbi:MAG: hypothetical protein ACRD1M_05675 [Terriglobales bacterium]